MSKKPRVDLTVQAKDCYDPADYITVHKDHYQRLLDASRTRIEITPAPFDPNKCMVCGGYHGMNMACPQLAPMCSAVNPSGEPKT